MTTAITRRPKLGADRLIDYDTQAVAVTLTEDGLADLLYGLVNTLRSCPRTRALFAAQVAGTRPLDNTHAARIRRDVARAMASHSEDHFELDVDEAADLAEQLSQACEDAPECANIRCGALAETQGSYCAACEDAS